MIWCPVDHCYYCGACYRDGCKPVHGDGPATRKAYRMLGLVVLLFFGSGFSPFALALVLTPTGTNTTGSTGLLGLGILGVFGIGAAWLGVTNVVRTVLHRRFVERHPAADITIPDETPDPSLTWRPNRAAPPTRVRRMLAAAAALVAVAAAIFLLGLIENLSAYVYAVAGFGGIILGLGVTVGFMALLPVVSPSAIAVAPDGVHFWYESPLDRRTQTDLMKWTRLNVLAMQSPNAGDAGKRLVRMFRLDPENADVVYRGWQEHRLAKPPPYRPSNVTPPIPRTSASVPAVPVPSPATGGAVLPSRAGPKTGGRRGLACARCHVRFPGYEGLRLLWCKVDRFYVCRRCWEDGCQEGHGRGVKAVSKPSRIASAVVVAAVLIALWYPGFSYDYTLTNVWHSGPIADISSLQAGQVVKVAGQITSPNAIAFGGYEILQGGQWAWEWNTGDVFSLIDSTGSIAVSTRDWYIVYYGPHYAPNSPNVMAGVYEPGDAVQIVGTVVQGSTGLVLDLQIIMQLMFAPLGDVAPTPLASFMVWFLPVAFVLIVGLGAAIFLQRRSRHAAATRGVPSRAVDTTADARDPSLGWRPNGRGTNPPRRTRGAAVAVLVGAAFLAVYPGFGPRTWFGLFSLGIIGTIVLMLETAAVYILLFGGVGRPSYVAVADDGFHMWFESPYDQHLNDTIFPWDQIRNIYMTGGKGAHWVLQWTTGEVTNLYMLSGSNLSMLMEEWTRRRMPAGA